MAYKILITPQAEEQLDHILQYMVDTLKNPKAALDFMEAVAQVYQSLVEHPWMYEEVEDSFLQARGYRKITVAHYIILYIPEEETRIVHVMGYFHSLENYKNRI